MFNYFKNGEGSIIRVLIAICDFMDIDSKNKKELIDVVRERSLELLIEF